MQNFLVRLDTLAGIETEKYTARWLERLAFVFMTLMFLSAPHSIAATQTAWLAGMFFWAIRIFVKPRPPFVKTPVNIALWIFAGWTLLTCIFSYAPDLSLSRMRNVSMFLAFFFLINNLRTKRAVVFLAGALIFSCMANVAWTGYERIVGRGVELVDFTPDGALGRGGYVKGDALLRADNRKISTPEELVEAVAKTENEKIDVYFYRPDFYFTLQIYKANLAPGNTAEERLGLTSWKHSRAWRSQGFFSHWATYSEILQLISSLAFGLLVAAFLARGQKRQDESGMTGDEPRAAKYLLPIAFCLGGMLFALLLTTTRASQFGFIVSAFAVVWLTQKRKWFFALTAVTLPLAIGGIIYLQQTRKVGVIDAGDGSTQYRLMMYRDGVRLWTDSPRNFVFGLGMDSIKRYWEEWGLFDKGWQPMGHFHSTVLQILFERGLPALMLWLWVLWRYAKFLVQSAKRRMQSSDGNAFDWKTFGILIGCFGGLAGFFVSGFVHNNIGDTQVATVFYMLMGTGISAALKDER